MYLNQAESYRVQRLDNAVSTDSVIVLLSGGIDSTAVLDFYLKRKSAVRAIYFDYGQPCSKGEQDALAKVVSHYSVEQQLVKLGVTPMMRKDEYLCRNSLLLFAAASLESEPTKIAMGIHSDSPYFDCSPLFVRNCQQLLDGYFGGTVRFEAPFLNFVKAQIIDYCKKNKVPLSMTFSCMRGNKPCGDCPSCLERKRHYGDD
jgi:7-cyano-7-deazaguanine synthase